jgi:Na+/H+-dicarboxylate symporter
MVWKLISDMMPIIIFIMILLIAYDLNKAKSLIIVAIGSCMIQFLVNKITTFTLLKRLKLDISIFENKTQQTRNISFITGSSLVALPSVIEDCKKKLGTSEKLDFIIQAGYPFIMIGSIVYITTLFIPIMMLSHKLDFWNCFIFFLQVPKYAAGVPGIPAGTFFVTDSLLSLFELQGFVWMFFVLDFITDRFCTQGNVKSKYETALYVNKCSHHLNEKIYHSPHI